MAEILTLPGVYRADLAESASIDKVLETVKGLGLANLTCVGRGIDGKIVIVGSQGDPDAMLGLLLRGMNWLAGQDIADLLETETPGA